MAPGAEEAIGGWTDPMPEDGDGVDGALNELIARGERSATRSSGPRFFHFVMGGGTPAALGADWLTSAYDQVAFGWASSPFAARLEQVAIDWLRQLFELPRGVRRRPHHRRDDGQLRRPGRGPQLVGRAARGRRRRAGAGRAPPPIDPQQRLPAPERVQAVGMLGLGRATFGGSDPRRGRPARPRGPRARAARAPSAPAIVIANAGEVNAGDFDPIGEMAELAEGARRLAARRRRLRALRPALRSERARSPRASSGPTRSPATGTSGSTCPTTAASPSCASPSRLPRALNVGAPYLPSPDDPQPDPSASSRRRTRGARARCRSGRRCAPTGATGYREMVERHLDLARHLAELVDAAPELERLAEVPLNIVCFRAHPAASPEERARRAEPPSSASGSSPTAGSSPARPSTTARSRCGPRSSTGAREPDVELLVAVVREILAQLT